MTVDTELAYRELAWTGVETSFAPGFPALDPSHVFVRNLDANGDIAALTRGVHFSVAIGVDNTVTITPLTMPSAPSTLLIERITPALQPIDFADLEDFSADDHTLVADRGAMRDAEIRSDVLRHIGPFTLAAGVVMFGDYRVSGSEAVDGDEFVTLDQVEELTGLLALQGYVNAAAASAATATTQAGLSATAKTAAETARDLAQQWAANPIGVAVSGGLFSSRSYANDAQNSATAAATSALILANPDYGTVAAAPTETRDYGTVP